LKALAKNWRQKARISASGLAPWRRPAGEGTEAEVMLAMTRPCCFRGGFCRAERPFEAPKASFGLIY
jgi:hypothetical protein